jgi:hypothetical protein
LPDPSTWPRTSPKEAWVSTISGLDLYSLYTILVSHSRVPLGVGPTLVDIIRPVRSKPVRIQRDARIWAQRPQVLSVPLHDQRAPPPTILRGLSAQILANGRQSVVLHPSHVLT